MLLIITFSQSVACYFIFFTCPFMEQQFLISEHYFKNAASEEGGENIQVYYLKTIIKLYV